MIKGITATVRGGRIEVDVPPGWVDGSAVEIFIVARPNLTVNDSPVSPVESARIWDLLAEEEKANAER